MPSDPHELPHELVMAEPIGGGLAVGYEIETGKRHARLVLIGETEGGESELLLCLESDHPVKDGHWGFGGCDVAWALAHVGLHVAAHIPVRCCGDNAN